MHLVGDTVKPEKGKAKVETKHVEPRPQGDSRSVATAISLMANMVETACEREPDLDLMRLINFMDLYRHYLEVASNPHSDLSDYIKSISRPSDAVLTQHLGDTELVSFERFVRDSQLLALAATAASRASGDTIAAPPPLTISANG